MPKQKKDQEKKPKQKSKSQSPSKSKKTETTKSKPEPKGTLIALDGANGSFLTTEGQRLAQLCGEEALWSNFDASNTFHELGFSKTKALTPTPRVLVLLYVSDLLFRLRWEIEPMLEEGRTVVAAPYVNTAIAFGVASGLSREWLETLFSFAPVPARSYRVKEKKKTKGKLDDWKKGDLDVPGFLEFCSATLTKNYPGWETSEVRAAMIEHLKDLEDRDKLRKFGKKIK